MGAWLSTRCIARNGPLPAYRELHPLLLSPRWGRRLVPAVLRLALLAAALKVHQLATGLGGAESDLITPRCSQFGLIEMELGLGLCLLLGVYPRHIRLAVLVCPTPNDQEPLSDDFEDCGLFWSPGLGPRQRMGCSNQGPRHNWANWQAPARSRHLGGVNACFVDGSVRFVRDSIASSVWELMLSRNDLQTYDYDF
jgi:prepilin-type processing-associated H-X9-DG protein